MKENILFFMLNYPYEGGLEKTTTRIGNYLIEREYKVHVLAANSKNVPSMNEETLPFYTLPCSSHIKSKKNIEYFFFLINKLKIDIVIYHGLYFNLHHFLFEVVRNRTFKLIVVHHNSPDAPLVLLKQTQLRPMSSVKNFIKCIFPMYYRLKFDSIKKDYNRLYGIADRIVLLSERYIPQFAEIGRISSRNKFIAISNMLSFDEISYYSQKQRLKKVIYLGRLDYFMKRIDRILYAWKDVQDKHPDWSLEIVGKGEYYHGLLRLASKLNLKNFSMNMNCLDIKNKLRESSILCLTSEFEGFGLVLTEAQQFGVVPIAYSSYEAVHDIIEDGYNGYLINPFDRDKFVEKLDCLMTEPEKLKNMSRNAVNSVDKFKPQIIVDKWESLINGRV